MIRRIKIGKRITFPRVGMAGDTLVEVLIAITVVSAILGAAYSSANRSLILTRQAQERVEALKLVEAQVERIRSLTGVSTSPVFTTTDYFCVDNARALHNLGTINRSDFSSITYPTACQQSPLNGVVYYVSVDRDAATKVFTAVVMWDQAGGRGRDEVRMKYRAYP